MKEFLQYFILKISCFDISIEKAFDYDHELANVPALG